MTDAIPYWQQVRADVPRWCLRMWSALLIIVAVMTLLSTTTPMTRLLDLCAVGFGLFTGLLYLRQAVRRRPRLLVLVLSLLIGLATWIIAADRPPDATRLRAEYVRRLQGFRGAWYLWGGETHIGIDCSGLARTALCEAMVVEGLHTLNPRLLGPRLWRFWWRDVGARAMGEGVYDVTRPLRNTHELATDSHDGLLPGDVAVAQGVHVLVYLGGRRWIEANPDDRHVVVNVARSGSPRAYFRVPVTVVRWRMLESTPVLH